MKCTPWVAGWILHLSLHNYRVKTMEIDGLLLKGTFKHQVDYNKHMVKIDTHQVLAGCVVLLMESKLTFMCKTGREWPLIVQSYQTV